jgi:DNA-directed RNA polymerase subunit RPC12/RpoP
MKLCDIDQLRLADLTRAQLEIDPVRAIVSDEFNRKVERPEIGYRIRAIKRLATCKLPIRTEANIAWDVMKNYVSLSCPYCWSSLGVRQEMEAKDGGGSGSITTQNYRCPACNAHASLSVGERDLTFSHD